MTMRPRRSHRIEQLRRRRIMAGANGIDTQLPAKAAGDALRHAVRHGSADAAGIVVDADAFDLGRNTVQQQALVRVELQAFGCRMA